MTRLSETLSGLIEQIEREQLADTVEISISDNGSTDETATVVAGLSRGATVQVRYNRLERNEGFSRNLANAVRHATGDYVALAGDDDVFVAGGVSALLAAVKLDVGVVLLNATGTRLQGSSTQPLAIRDAAACVEQLGIFHASFIGNIVIRRELFTRHCTRSLLDSAYVHTGIVLRALREASGCFLNVTPMRVDDSLREWRARQPLYTAVDMARLQTDEMLVWGAPQRLARRVYWTLLRSLPKAFLGIRKGWIVAKPENPYEDLSLANICACYRASLPMQALAFVIAISSRFAPIAILQLLQHSEVR